MFAQDIVPTLPEYDYLRHLIIDNFITQQLIEFQDQPNTAGHTSTDQNTAVNDHVGSINCNIWSA